MKLHFYLLALAPFALAGCVVTEPAPPVATTTTVTREVTTTGPMTNETYVTQEPPAVRVERLAGPDHAVPPADRALRSDDAVFTAETVERARD